MPLHPRSLRGLVWPRRLRPHPQPRSLTAPTALPFTPAPELDQRRPDGLRYATYRVDDGDTFVALIDIDDPGIMADLPAFQRYRGGLEDRCIEPPQMLRLDSIGSYGFD